MYHYRAYKSFEHIFHANTSQIYIPIRISYTHRLQTVNMFCFGSTCPMPLCDFLHTITEPTIFHHKCTILFAPEVTIQLLYS